MRTLETIVKPQKKHTSEIKDCLITRAWWKLVDMMAEVFHPRTGSTCRWILSAEITRTVVPETLLRLSTRSII